MNDKSWYVYLVRCQNNALYCGITDNLEKRIAAHNSGKGSKSCRAHGLPVTFEIAIQQPNKSNALKLEAQIKKLSKKHKEQFINAAKKDSIENPIEKPLIPTFKSCVALNNLIEQRKEFQGLLLYLQTKVIMS